ncbi:MAG: beta-mannosidase [Bacteroidales bacterium]|nr:beta-mannosidase [Bacteroidales bacterium]
MIPLFVFGCGRRPRPVDDEISGDKILAGQLLSVADAGKVMYGHQDDLSYGHSWKVTDWENDDLERSDVKDVSGMYPAVLGFDLGGIELGDSCNLDGVPFGLIRKAALTHRSRGGVVTFSWHLRNPLTGGDSWDISSDQVVASVLEGGEKHEEFLVWLDRLADFLNSLGHAPVIFRPWHENIGSWFWWGGKLCAAEQYKALFRLTRERLEEKGVKNLLWCYSPNGPISKEDYLSRYPGDDIVDILGTDLYEYNNGDLEAAGAAYMANLKQMLTTLTEISKEHLKLMCLSETGLEGIPDPHWWTQRLYPAIQGFPICYLLTWRNAHDRPGHFYGPWKGFENEEDFKLFSEKKDIVLL